MITRIDDHGAQASARLTSAYGQAARVQALLSSFAQAVQAIEDSLAQVSVAQLGKGSQLAGAALDVLGRVVGLPRDALPDDIYRVLLLAKIGENSSDGSVAAVQSVAKLAFQSDAVFAADANAPVNGHHKAGATLQLALGTPQTPPQLFDQLIRLLVAQTLAAGVSLSSVSTFDAKGAFAFAGPQPWVRGFASVAGISGGPMAHLIYTDAKETPR